MTKVNLFCDPMLTTLSHSSMVSYVSAAFSCFSEGALQRGEFPHEAMHCCESRVIRIVVGPSNCSAKLTFRAPKPEMI